VVLAELPNPDGEAKTAGKTEFMERAMPARPRNAPAPEPIQPHEKGTQAETILPPAWGPGTLISG